MLLTKKDKIIATLFIFFFLGAFIALAWLAKSGGFGILADVIKNGL